MFLRFFPPLSFSPQVFDRVDWVLVRGEGVAAKTAAVLNTPVPFPSDHWGLVATVDVVGGTPLLQVERVRYVQWFDAFFVFVPHSLSP